MRRVLPFDGTLQIVGTEDFEDEEQEQMLEEEQNEDQYLLEEEQNYEEQTQERTADEILADVREDNLTSIASTSTQIREDPEEGEQIISLKHVLNQKKGLKRKL